ncbi:UNVERIFIED_CONTAM: hypothetical protein FKN15_008125 [Acipenser sinensis]
MQNVCSRVEEVIRNVELRKGELGKEDVLEIVSSWQELQSVQSDIARLELQKRDVSERVKALVVSVELCPSLPPTPSSRPSCSDSASRSPVAQQCHPVQVLLPA